MRCPAQFDLNPSNVVRIVGSEVNYRLKLLLAITKWFVDLVPGFEESYSKEMLKTMERCKTL
jgi:hypothetical protein